MPRIAGINIPLNKQVEVAITSVKGIGHSTAKKILNQLKVDPNKIVKDLTDDEINKIRKTIETQFKVEGDLVREQLLNIKRLKEIGCYRGTRHSRRLPARGQRTKTNSRTVRGNVRRTMGSGKVKAQKT